MIPRRNVTTQKSLLGYAILYLCTFFLWKKYPLFLKKSFQKYFSTKNIFLFNYGRTALYTIFRITGFEKEDEIIVPNYYLKEIVLQIKKIGLNPVFCDINKHHLSLDDRDVISKINQKTKFILLLHSFGYCQNVDQFIKNIKKKKKDIIIIEDCAHSFGGEYNKKKLGTFGDFSFFSFNYIKPLNLLNGGLLLVNSNYYKRKAISTYKLLDRPSKKEVFIQILHYYLTCFTLKTPLFSLIKIFLRKEKTKNLLKKIHKIPSKKTRTSYLSNFQCMLGYYELKLFSKKQKKLEETLQCYKKNINPLYWNKRPLAYNSVYSNYSLFFTTKRRSQEAEYFMFKNKIDIGIKDELMDLCKKKQSFENSEDVYHSLIQIPLYCDLKKGQIKKISFVLNNFFENDN
jgi:dTDP-4-amino-4,6-dideoxygalactose transaminase